MKLYSSWKRLGNAFLNSRNLQYQCFFRLTSSMLPLMVLPDVRYDMTSYCSMARSDTTVAMPGTTGIRFVDSRYGRPRTSTLPRGSWASRP